MQHVDQVFRIHRAGPPSVKWGMKCLYQGCVYAWNASRENIPEPLGLTFIDRVHKKLTSIKYDVKKNVTPIRE